MTVRRWKCALITGASSGIGAAFAEILAPRCEVLILVARSTDRLQQVAQQLRSETGSRVEVLADDLTRPAAGKRLREQIDALGLAVDLLINNAGIGAIGPFLDAEPGRNRDMIALNCAAVADLIQAFLPPMLERRRGGIINVASVSAFGPLPYLSLYAATKAFVVSLTQGLAGEYRRRGIDFLAVCPGPVDTPFFEATGRPDARHVQPRGTLLDAHQVAAGSLEALERRGIVYEPGYQSRILAAAVRRVPLSILAPSMQRLLRR